MKSMFRIGLVALLVLIVGPDARAQVPFKIPLYIFNTGTSSTHKEYKVGIRLKVGAVKDRFQTPWRMYEFDTGGSGFLAFPFKASGTNVDGAYTVNYGSGNRLSGNDSETTVTFEGLGAALNRSVRTNLVLITSATSDKDPDPFKDWQSKLPGTPPLETYFYGDFGMSMDMLEPMDSSSGKPNLFAIIPQLAGKRSAGFIIHLGERPADDATPGKYGEVGRGWIQVGLTAKQKQASSWDSAVAMVAPSGEVFPKSGLPVYEEILSTGTMSLTGLEPKACGIVYDTGAPDTEIHPVGSDVDLHDPIKNALESSDPITLKLVGTPENPSQDSTILDFVVGDSSGKDEAKISTKNVIDSTGLYVNTGITAFFGNDVVYNLEAGFVGFKSVSGD